MSFSFTVETGEGLANANSYISVAEADDEIALDVGNTAAWAALDDATKQLRIVYATRWLDDRAIWRGTKATATQALDWPRKDAKDLEGCAVSQTVVPIEVKHAVAKLANFLLAEGEPDATSGYVSRLKADTFEVEFQKGFIRSTSPPFLRFALNGLGTMATEYGFKKVVRA
jgi:hypothetical protein